MTPIFVQSIYTNQKVSNFTYTLAVLLCTSSEQAKKKIKKAISFKIEPKRMNYLEVNLKKEVKDLYTKYYKTLLT